MPQILTDRGTYCVFDVAVGARGAHRNGLEGGAWGRGVDNSNHASPDSRIISGMTPRNPLPAAFDDEPWSVEEALDLGITRKRLRSGDLTTPFRGVRMLGPIADSALAYRPLLRHGDRFSSITAAGILGAPMPRWAESQLHVTAGAGLTAARMRGVVGHASDGRGFVEVRGLPISHPGQVFLELATLLGVEDLVAIGDHLVLEPRVAEPGRPYLSLDELARVCAAVGRRSIRRARAAQALVRVGAASRRETLMRLRLVDAGLPEPQLDYPVYAMDGTFIGWFDCAYPDARVLVEYDGDQHRTDARQYERDMRRFEMAAEAGWITIRVRKWGLFEGLDDTVSRVRRALHNRGW